MAAVTITHAYADDETVSITVEVDESYPDALAEARATAVRAYHQATGVEFDTTATLDEE